MKVKALVAARAGSQRVLAKNTRSFASSTLLDVKLAQLTRIAGLDGVVLSSEDDAILAYAERYGCAAARRPQELASGEALMSDVYEFMAQQMDADVIVYANCTSPMIRDATVESLVAHAGDLSEGCESINTGTLIKEFMLLDGKPLNYDPSAQPRSQDLPDITAINFAVSVLRRSTMIARRNVVGASPRIHVLDEVEGTDIDSLTDFTVAEFLYRARGGERYLRGL